MHPSNSKASCFDVDAHADELRAIHPLGCEIARDLLSRAAYNRICERRHVSPNTVAKVSAFVYKKPVASDVAGLQDLLGNSNESPDAMLVALLIEVCRYMGSFSRTQAAVWLRDQSRQIMQAATKYLEGRIDNNAVNDLLAALWAAGNKAGLEKGADECANNNHERIRESAKAEGHRESFTEGKNYASEWLQRLTYEQVTQDMANRDVVPIALAMNLRNHIDWMQRHLLRACPHCNEVLTIEVCDSIAIDYKSLPPDQKVKLDKMRRRKRELTGEWWDPDPFRRDFPWGWGEKVFRPAPE